MEFSKWKWKLKKCQWNSMKSKNVQNESQTTSLPFTLLLVNWVDHYARMELRGCDCTRILHWTAVNKSANLEPLRTFTPSAHQCPQWSMTSSKCSIHAPSLRRADNSPKIIFYLQSNCIRWMYRTDNPHHRPRCRALSFCSVVHSIILVLQVKHRDRWCLGHFHEQVRNLTHGGQEEQKPTG